jgi:hypothetical protein
MAMAHAEAVPAELAAFLHGKTDGATFRHADHIRVAFEMLQRHAFLDAAAAYSTALKDIAARAGHPAAYHETITVAFLSLVAERCAERDYADFAAFATANADLMDKSVLRHWYGPARLGSAIARRTFVLPQPAGTQR